LQERVTPNAERMICNIHESRFSALIAYSHLDEV
jgi:hypothetical protein